MFARIIVLLVIMVTILVVSRVMMVLYDVIIDMDKMMSMTRPNSTLIDVPPPSIGVVLVTTSDSGCIIQSPVNISDTSIYEVLDPLLLGNTSDTSIFIDRRSNSHPVVEIYTDNGFIYLDSVGTYAFRVVSNESVVIICNSELGPAPHPYSYSVSRLSWLRDVLPALFMIFVGGVLLYIGKR